MTNTKDFSNMIKDMMGGSFPVDMSAMEDAFKTSASLNEKLSSVALEAAGKSAEISNKWAIDTLSKLNEMSRAKAEPADYAKAMTDFAAASAEVAAENMAAFAEIAKKVQMDTVELMMAAGKDMTEDASAAMKKATDGVTAAAKKATTAAAKAAK
ncbi:phasin, PhaP [Pseudodonghicola flavimaris]|uniref:Phasin, PhaP n=1 Tax=Pseudodonghicola flavimaris TaxID=3050036 RepID=A0ABT7EUQ0_9RHOB|nr:phasin, PhaP [Pseudodonghicola flavimaris]MDK3016073.1 phasin, PhaP [Pseudodonghicola flavimaris]